MLSKFTPEEAAAEIEKSREAIRRIDAMRAGPRPAAENPEALRSAAPASFEPRVESTNMRHRREIEAQEKAFEIERARERRDRLDTPPISYVGIDARIASALSAERAMVLPIIAETVNEAFAAARERHASQLRERTRELELQVARLESALNALQAALATERSKIVDLPALPRMQ